MEKKNSMLASGELGPMPALGGFDNASLPPNTSSTRSRATSSAVPHAQEFHPEEELTQEQLQMFEKENQDMLKHYQDTLDQVRWVEGIPRWNKAHLTCCRNAEKSLVEISELQTELVNNLATQSAHIDQLVADSFLTTENVGGGNKELKKATERKSTAKYVFYASCSLSLFLVVWDLII